MKRAFVIPLVVLAAWPAGASASARIAPGAPHRAGEVVVQRRGHAVATVEQVRRGETVSQAIARLRRVPGVRSANANYIARVSQGTAPPEPTPTASPTATFVPNDPGQGTAKGGWQGIQWNFLAETGVNAPAAWRRLIDLGRPGGRGVTVAVLDTGVAYSDRGRYRRSPDLAASRFVKGYDFVARDQYANDENGHGTHVASTIGEQTNNAVGLTGIAYNVRLMPVRVLNAEGEGDAGVIARGIRFAARKGAPLINLSFEFGPEVTADVIPDILAAIRYARRKGSIVIGAAGNESATPVALPARAPDVLAVGATTEHGCHALYSNTGSQLDIVAPGGGPDDPDTTDPGCRPDDLTGRDIFQVTFDQEDSLTAFGQPEGYLGTSMAAPHVTGVAALVIASGVIGERPSPAALEARLKATARDLGTPGRDNVYGAGLVDAGAAVGATPVRAAPVR